MYDGKGAPSARQGRGASVSRRAPPRLPPAQIRAGAAAAWKSYLAYYGPEGFKKEVLGILEKMDSEPRKGAAMFRNRITTLQHSELWRDALTLFMSEKPALVRPAWTRLIEEWLTRPISANKA